MKVSIIEEYKSAFLEHLSGFARPGSVYEEGYKWDVISTWKDNFTLEDLDITIAYEESLKNNHSGRLWGGEKFSIKSEMLQLIKVNPLLMQVTFKDLFKEERELSMRLSRFCFHCDQALDELNNKDDRFNDHKQDYYSASLYLSLEYPEKYGLYQPETFYIFMEIVESRNIPTEQEMERYFKVLNALYIVLSKDVEFMNGFNFIIGNRGYTGKSLFLVNDFMDFVVGQ